ncbi:hypothetical protein HYPSUDRAFT_132048 [Hypholoma sublateritium FD-334 SS-4]|uniref:Uncharacterized protein n=1 Tax=Hypholoma sublateritium (strain FD-334 SS-4) TaxID=945553 RepID=A0A0D2Q603_HYPSF|nr:hypothetical protein HYPSUDRAFT_132048 [Hypholoma sublateritium FD-334 SS-4]
MDPPSVLNIHTPSSSFAIVHSLTQETLLDLYNKLSRKAATDYYGARVGPGWLKYEYNETVWNLDDDADYSIFAWRQQQQPAHGPASPVASSSRTPPPPPPPVPANPATPTLHLHDPAAALPVPPAYRNPAYYTFQAARAAALTPPRRSPAPSRTSTGGGSRKGRDGERNGAGAAAVPKFKTQFDRFHSENGVRTVTGQIGPVKDVRMLLKAGYRHVYVARKFAIKHGFIPPDAAPGNYGYGGLVSIGAWPVTLAPSGTPVMVEVFLSEEPHFDVVLGRSFIEARQIRMHSIDPTDVVCLDTGEKIECELVILKDGRGEIVTVT